MMPSFIVIGVQKGGTTSLFWNLTDHPNILAPCWKELQVFDRGHNFSKRYYRSFFPFGPRTGKDGNLTITGEATPTYLLNHESPARVKEVAPDVKLIVMLRNPVDRAVSQYRQNLKAKREPLDFRGALDAEHDRVAASLELRRRGTVPESLDWLLFRYRGNGEYADHLRNWFEHFDRSQFLFIKSEDYFSDAQRVLHETHDFLGVPRHTSDSTPIRNKSKVEAPISPEVLDDLRQHFETRNKDLYELLGIDYSW